jgi:hypothetical protein
VPAGLRTLLTDATQASATLVAETPPAGGRGDVERARLLVHRAVAGDDPADRAMLARAADAAATRAASPRWQAEARLARREVTWNGPAVWERLAVANEALALADDDDVAGRALAAIARDLIATNQLADAAAALDRLLALPRLRDDLRGAARLQQAALALAAGDQTATAETIEWAAAGGFPRAVDDPDDPLATLLLVLAIEQRQLAEARPSLGDAVARWPGNLLWTGALVAAEAEADRVAVGTRLDAAAPLVERGAGRAGDVAGMVLLHRAATRTGHPLADRLGRQLHPHRDELAIAGNVGVLGRVDDLLATP